MKPLLLLLLLLPALSAMRLAPDAPCRPHMVQGATMVEISSRGTRIIMAPTWHAAAGDVCAPSNNSCACNAVTAKPPDGTAIVYFPRTNELFYFKQTFGPMAYTAAIMCALVA
jgi:hypothetical protein